VCIKLDVIWFIKHGLLESMSEYRENENQLLYLLYIIILMSIYLEGN